MKTVFQVKEASHTRSDIVMILFTLNVQSKQTYRERKYIGNCLGLED